MSDFLPDKYKVPVGESRYTTLEKGENKIRILVSPIVGFEAWLDVDGGRKPRRVPMEKKDLLPSENTPKHFWGLEVWNYKTNRVEVLMLTQKTIMKAITSYSENDEWGSPLSYDIVIKKEGEKLETSYTVMAQPPKDLSKKVTDEVAKTNVDLDQLFSSKESPYGGDPFANSEGLSDKELDEIDKAIE